MVDPSSAAIQLWTDELNEPPRLSTVLVIGDHAINTAALRTLLESDGYHVLTAHPSNAALEMLRESTIDMVILDTSRAGDDCLDLCCGIRTNPRSQLIPILQISRVSSAETEIACMAAGADSVLGWPFDTKLFATRVRTMLSRKAAVDRLENSDTILTSLAQAVEQRDNITGGHCDRIAALCVAMGTEMALPSEHLLALHRGGYLHDIGKIGIPDSILLKPGSLDDEEWRIMRTHTTKGEDICRPMRFLVPVLPIIRSHHERWDGSGYPDGLKGRAIPLLARVLQMADIYDALTSPRSYKPALPSTEAIGVMQDETDRGWHDPELMTLLLRFKQEDVRDTLLSLNNLRSTLGR